MIVQPVFQMGLTLINTISNQTALTQIRDFIRIRVVVLRLTV